jgi:hypothetical protein
MIQQLFLVCALISGLMLPMSVALAQPNPGQPIPNQPIPGQVPPVQANPGAANNQPVPNPPRPNAPGANIPGRFFPDEIAPELLINKPLLTAAAVKQRNLIATAFNKAMRNGIINTGDEAIIKEMAKFMVYRLASPEERDKFRYLRQDISSLPDRYNASPAKDLFLKEAMLRCVDLLDNHLAVRIEAVLVMSQLNTVKGNPVSKTPPVPYEPTYEPFLNILKDAKQHIAVKVAAVNGLERICVYGNPRVDIRSMITNVLVNELKNNPNAHWWYRQVCIRVLGTTGVIYDNVDRKPFVTQLLLTMMIDNKENWMVRTECARTLGRLPLDVNHRVDLIAYEITNLALELAQAYNQNLSDPFLRDAFWNIYLAFHFENDEERQKQLGLVTQTEKTALRSYDTQVKSAYLMSLKLINSVFAYQVPETLGSPSPPIKPATMKEVSEWLKANPPANKEIMPGMPPLRK